MSKIKSFRGLIAHNTQDTIVLHTNTGSTGYRINKLEVISSLPATTTQESVIKIFKVDGKTIDETIDFSDNTLLATAYFEGHSNSTTFGGTVIIFDNEIFNQDIYIMCFDGSGGSQPVNYYMELEQVKLDLNENTVATLKDIRNVTAG
jgi:hypothetical protein